MAELIIEDLSESPPPSKGPPPWWAGVAVGVAIGLAAAFLLGVGDDAGQPATTTVPAAGTSSTVPQVTSDTLHPDFQQGLSAIVESDVQGLDWIDWPPADIPLPVSVERLPFGDLGVTVLPTLDPSGHFVAVEVPMNDSPAGVLYAGPVTNVDTVATDVTGHAWHDSVTGFLAFTTEKDGEVGLWTTPLGGVQNVTNAIGFSGARVVGFGNWGWALQDADGETVHIFNEFGELLRSEPGEFLDSHSSGHLLLLDEGAVVEVNPAGRRREVCSRRARRDRRPMGRDLCSRPGSLCANRKPRDGVDRRRIDDHLPSGPESTSHRGGWGVRYVSATSRGRGGRSHHG